MKIKTIVRNIRGSDWTFNVMTKRAYEKKHGDDSAAITTTNARYVDIQSDHLAPAILRHELLHIYVNMSSTSSSDLKPDQVEEMCAEIIGTHGLEICMIADDIVNYFILQED